MMTTLSRRAFALALTAASLTGCSAESLSADPQVIAAADAAFQEFASGNDKALLARLPKEVSEDPGQVRMIGVLRQVLPEGKAKPYDLIGWRTFAGTGGRQHTVVLRYAYETGEHFTLSYLFHKPAADGPWNMISFNIKPSSAEEIAAPVQNTSLVGSGKKGKPS